MKIATRCVRLNDPRDPYGAVAPPLYQTATFRQESATGFGEYDYSRTANPTRSLLEAKLADLEGARHALAYTSGMAAVAALLGLLEPGDEVLAGDDLYGGTTRLLGRIAPERGLTVRFVDATDPWAVEAALARSTRLLLVETPTNPLLEIADLERLAEIARRHGALLAVDNSLATPLLQRPLERGAHLVVHSATKGLGGHADLVAGAVVTGDEALHERLAFRRNAEGTALAPFEAWLLLRGLKTLAPRLAWQCRSAGRIAEFLAIHPAVERVFYPGLPDHHGRTTHERQSSGAGPLVSFTTGDPELSRRLVESLELFTIAVSFGAVGSVASLPCRMSHASVPDELAGRLRPPPDLVRLSVGVEDPDDLLADLERALAPAAAGAAAHPMSAREGHPHRC
jgi:cystathionine beta-lyase